MTYLFATIKAILPHSDVDYDEVYFFVYTNRNLFYGVRCLNNEHICSEKNYIIKTDFHSKAENRGVAVSVCAPAHLPIYWMEPPVAKRRNIKLHRRHNPSKQFKEKSRLRVVISKNKWHFPSAIRHSRANQILDSWIIAACRFLQPVSHYGNEICTRHSSPSPSIPPSIIRKHPSPWNVFSERVKLCFYFFTGWCWTTWAPIVQRSKNRLNQKQL